MKKILGIALFTVALVACKKENTKTITKVNPETGKTETVTVEVPAEEEVKAAIVDSAGIFKQKFYLEKGKTYPLIAYQRDIQNVSTPDGKAVSGTSESTDEMTVTVNDFKDNVYDLSVNLVAKRNSTSANGKTVVSDTKAAAPKEEQLKGMYTINKAITGNKLAMKMDVNGKIISVTGFDPIYTKIATALSGLVKDAKQRTEIVGNFKKGFNEATIKEQFEKNLKIIPAKGVKIGEKWTASEDIIPGGDLKLTSTYALTKVEGGKAEISVNGNIPTKSDKQSKEGITHTMTLGGSQTGKIIFDSNTGWILHENISIKTNQKESISDGKKSQSMSQTSTSSIIINPSYK